MLRLFCFASFSSLCFHWSRGPSFNNSSKCRRPDSHKCLYILIFSFCLFGDVAFFEYFLYHCRFFFVWSLRRNVFSSRMVSFYLVTTGWIFDISLRENSINQSIINRCRYMKPGGVQRDCKDECIFLVKSDRGFLQCMWRLGFGLG